MLALCSIAVLKSDMFNPMQYLSPWPRVALTLAALAGALIAGAAFAGWLDHGAQIFLTMASDAWAYCF
jgi:hypothetical protein